MGIDEIADEVTPEQTAKLASILETKWTRLVEDSNKLREELDAARIAGDILQKDADYWHARALAAELRGDKHWADMDFMLQQWHKLSAQCAEVNRTIKRGVLGELPAPETPPGVVVFNRN